MRDPTLPLRSNLCSPRMVRPGHQLNRRTHAVQQESRVHREHELEAGQASCHTHALVSLAERSLVFLQIPERRIRMAISSGPHRCYHIQSRLCTALCASVTHTPQQPLLLWRISISWLNIRNGDCIGAVNCTTCYLSPLAVEDAPDLLLQQKTTKKLEIMSSLTSDRQNGRSSWHNTFRLLIIISLKFVVPGPDPPDRNYKTQVKNVNGGRSTTENPYSKLANEKMQIAREDR